MLRGTLGTVLASAAIVSMAGATYAQQSKPASNATTAQKTAATEKAAAKPPAIPDSTNNIKVDLTIVDQAGPGEAARRSVSMLVAD